jgi:putative NADPH-quinone reductase
MHFHIIIDHPWSGSFNYAVLDAFLAGLNMHQHQTDILDLNQEAFNPIFSEEELAVYTRGISLDPMVKDCQKRLLAADFLVLIFPIWWNVMPARLKGWMDKVLLPGFAFTEEEPPKPLLTHIQGAAVLTTTATPDKLHRETYHEALHWVLCEGTLAFCGIEPVTWLNFGQAGIADRAKHADWLKSVQAFAAEL